jgi:DNA-binding MarR family transcriptional regulator
LSNPPADHGAGPTHPVAVPGTAVPPGATSETLQLLRALLDVGAQVAPAVARRAEMSHSELAALELLMAHQVGPADLARHLQVTSAASSGIVDRLERRGHVRREPDTDDKRRTRVVVTDSARAEVIGHLMPMFASLDALDATLSEDDRVVVERFLRGAIEALERLL